MTVEQLIKELEKIKDKKRVVVMSKDGEGNDYSPLSSLGPCAYEADTTYSGFIGLEKLTPKAIADGYDEDDVIENGVPAICLWPTN